MAEENSIENLEDENDEHSRHRRERRDLQSTIQQLKKSVNKNDKARKKKVDSEIKELEDAFAKRWQHFDPNAAPEPVISNSTEVCTEDKQHVSRKARRQANKEKRYNEAHADDVEIDYENQPETIRRRNESSSIDTQLAARGLKVHSIPSDGNCLFASIVDQTSDLTIRQLRQMIAEYLQQHKTEYEPFIETDFNVYCEKLAKENVWGGQIELEICAKILQRSIEVIQGNGNEPIRVDSSNTTQTPIVLTYHRYLYANGEHYNSTREKTEDQQEDEE